MEKSPMASNNPLIEVPETPKDKSDENPEVKQSSESRPQKRERSRKRSHHHHREHHKHKNGHRSSHHRHSSHRHKRHSSSHSRSSSSRSHSRSKSRSHFKRPSGFKDRKEKEVPFKNFPPINRVPRGIFESELPEQEETKKIQTPLIEQSSTIQILLTQPLTTVDPTKNNNSDNQIKSNEFSNKISDIGNTDEELDNTQSYFRIVEREREQWEARKAIEESAPVDNTSM